MIRFIIFFILLCQSVQSFSAISKDIKRASELVSLLKLPKHNRKIVLKGRYNPKDLYQVAMSDRYSLQVRWRAVTSLGFVYEASSVEYLKRLLVHKKWFLRNSATLAVQYIKRKDAVKLLRERLIDKSLVVRTSAVQIIKKIGAIELEEDLWKSLSDSKNFKKGQSLWVRRYIVGALASFSRQGQEIKFARLLKDKDKRLHPFAVRALQKITGLRLVRSKKITKKRVAWLKRYNLN